MAADGALSNEDIDFILDGVMRRAQRKGKPFHPVSYTHLTLPTSDLV